MSETATRVAIIDDDESLCRSLSRLLRQAGFHPLTYLSAEEFLDSADRSRFGCLLIDIQLGGMSGIELRRQLLSERDMPPVIRITVDDEPAARIEPLNTGCAGFFLKTDASSAIIEALRRATTRP